MLIGKSWIWNNCKFAQRKTYLPSVEDVNMREPGIKDVDLDWDYAGRDSDGEKIYYPLLEVTFIGSSGKFETKWFHSEINESVKDLQRRYNEWANAMHFVPLPIQEKDYEDDYSHWQQELHQEERQKTEKIEDQTIEDQLRKFSPKPVGKYLDKLK
jgi:hypothetical protein